VSTLVTSDWERQFTLSLKLEEVLSEEYQVISLFVNVLPAGVLVLLILLRFCYQLQCQYTHSWRWGGSVILCCIGVD
jgi:hypothetical protein